MAEEFSPFADLDPLNEFNLYADEPKPDTLEPTWFILDTEPGMDDLAGTTGNILKTMKEQLKIFPFQDLDKHDRLFLARFEFPKGGERFTYPKAVFADKKVGGFIDFLAGFPIDCIEMLVAIGEYSTKADKVSVKPGDDRAAAPIPDKFFKWPDDGKVLLNLTAIATKDLGKIIAPNLDGEPKPANAHWWFRIDLVNMDEKKWPVIGEFFGLGVRMMPDVPWGKQKSSPFIYSGNWMDSVYLASAAIKEIIDPTDDVPYPTYTVNWHGKDIENVKPSDFAEYRVDDRVTILKDVSTDKKTQLWKDSDMKEFGDNWTIIPLTYYGGI